MNEIDLVKRFDLSEEVGLVTSNEAGTVVGCAEYCDSAPQYFVRYKNGTGCQVEAWFHQSALRKIVSLLLLALIPLFMGCEGESVEAAPAKVLWNEGDSISRINELQTQNELRFESIESQLSDLKVTASLDKQTVSDRLDALETRAPSRPAVSFPSASVATSDDLPTLCITIAGIDHDIQPLIDHWCNPLNTWQWPGCDGTQAEPALRRHIAEEFAVSGIDAVPFAQLRDIHDALHNQQLAQASEKVKIVTRAKVQETPAVNPQRPSVVVTPWNSGPTTVNCPHGQCPAPSSQYREKAKTVYSAPRFSAPVSAPRVGLFRLFAPSSARQTVRQRRFR